jgi:hypothetical protein
MPMHICWPAPKDAPWAGTPLDGHRLASANLDAAAQLEIGGGDATDGLGRDSTVQPDGCASNQFDRSSTMWIDR